jgi:hypothetical protein
MKVRWVFFCFATFSLLFCIYILNYSSSDELLIQTRKRSNQSLGDVKSREVNSFANQTAYEYESELPGNTKVEASKGIDVEEKEQTVTEFREVIESFDFNSYESVSDVGVEVVSAELRTLELLYEQGGGKTNDGIFLYMDELDPLQEINEVALPAIEPYEQAIPDETRQLEEEYVSSERPYFDANLYGDPDEGNFINPLEFGDEPAIEAITDLKLD